MTPLDLALRYLNAFYAGDLATLRPLLDEHLAFEGPWARYDTAADYLAALEEDPPSGMSCTLLETFASETTACVLYRFEKGPVRTPMAQWFETDGTHITRILLIFDTGAFG